MLFRAGQMGVLWSGGPLELNFWGVSKILSPKHPARNLKHESFACRLGQASWVDSAVAEVHRVHVVAGELPAWPVLLHVRGHQGYGTEKTVPITKLTPMKSPNMDKIVFF